MGNLKISKQIRENQTTMHSCIHEGFLLIELMVALMVLIFFMYLMYRYHSISIEARYEAIKRYEVTNLMHSFFAKALYDPSLIKQNNYVHEGCTLTWTIEDFPFKKTEFLTLFTSQVRCLKLQAQWKGWHNKLNTMVIASGITI